jgi:hypothetical protein
MPSTPSGSRGQIELPCNDKGTSETILVLFVSTEDAHSDEVKITIKRTRIKKCHAPGGFVMYPLYNPETGGAKCPPGTHFSSTAAWCCPDGMELDETVASFASICCPTSKLPIFRVLMQQLINLQQRRIAVKVSLLT